MFRHLLCLLLLGITGSYAQPGKPVNEIDTLSLQDLMNIKLTVASAKELTPRESPGVVSYITAEDIRQSGARDLMEILRFVPGFEFGIDVEGVIGLGIRGNWAHEGKTVLLIDGIEMNETLYSTLQFGNHYPTDNIERIEIIRGPGSAMYGGFAAYAVINVITRKARNASETRAAVQTGMGTKGLTGGGIFASQGFHKEKVSAGISMNYSQAERSQENYTDVYGSSFNMHGNSDLDNLFINGYLNVGNTKLQVISDHYHTTTKDGYVENFSKKFGIDFNSLNASISQDIKAGQWKIIPKLIYSTQQPWLNRGEADLPDNVLFDIPTKRITGSVNASASLSDHLNLVTGVQYFYDHSENEIDGRVFIKTNTPEFSYQNSAVFVQGLYTLNNWNLVAGIRGNYNSQFDPTFTPRVGATYVRENWHFKTLYNKSFRSPNTQNLNLAEVMYPEQTSVGEIEMGVALGKSLYVTANVFSIATTDPIVYYYDTLSNSDAYTNLSLTGSIGTELNAQFKSRKSLIEFNLSYYCTGNTDQLPNYEVQDKKQYLGLAPIKYNFRYRYQFSKSLNGCLTTFYQSSKYAITSVEPVSEIQTYTRLPQNFTCNLHVEYNFPMASGFGIAAGVNNITDEKLWYAQPYNSNHAPLPGMGREFTLKVFYRNF